MADILYILGGAIYNNSSTAEQYENIPQLSFSVSYELLFYKSSSQTLHNNSGWVVGGAKEVSQPKTSVGVTLMLMVMMIVDFTEKTSFVSFQMFIISLTAG